MKKFLSALAFSVIAATAFAQQATPRTSDKPAAEQPADKSSKGDCASKAIDKNGKPLAGAARASFMKKCEKDQAGAGSDCEKKAIDKNGKPLAGAAKASFMKKCEADAKK